MDFIPLTEDLMKEHALVTRILIIYDKCVEILSESPILSTISIVKQTAQIVRNFVENYHEYIEETYIFPLFSNDKKYDILIKELIHQHTISREITSSIITDIENIENIKNVIDNIKKFNKIYVAHINVEDLSLIKNVRSHISEDEFIKLSKKFDEIEDEKLGKHGFKKILKELILIEHKLGIRFRI